MPSVTTRFAPSPTGHLHIGGARTALFSWLHARQNNGHFVLRIEDTDRARSTEEFVQAILQGMRWLGLEADESPVFQTQRFDRYREVIQSMLEQNLAYHCYCSREELDEMREQQREQGLKPRYDGRCRHRNTPVEGVEPVVRFRNPDDGDVVINDLIRGRIVISNGELDDLIIQRSDGTPTYNLTVVVDDTDMGVTQVIRGDDHINNTPRQINLMHALGLTPPQYAHVPMILGADGSRLSKRHGAVSVLQYRDEGFLPQALINYLVRLGWSHGDQELFSRDELIKLFDLTAVHKSPASFDPEKLLWLNQQYLMTLPADEIVPHFKWHLDHKGIDIGTGPELDELVEAQRGRCKTLTEMVDKSIYFFSTPNTYEEKAARKNLKPEAVSTLRTLLQAFTELAEWNSESIHKVVEAVSESLDVKMGKVAQPLRVAVSGGAVSPPIDQTLKLLGREATLLRINNAIAWIDGQSAA